MGGTSLIGSTRGGSFLGRSLLAGVFALSLASCGVTYKSPSVRNQADGQPVVVVSMSPQTVSVANASPYASQSLPSVFFSAAGTGAGRGVGALPETPYLPDESQQAMQYRPLPDVTPEPYRIGVGDQLLLATKSNASSVEQLTGLLAAENSRQGYSVRGDGTIAIPAIGPIQVAGLTQDVAENRLFNALVDAGIDPTFSLEISEFNSQRVAVGGAVKNSVIVPITPSDLTLGEALIAAGGFDVRDRQFASIRVYRDGTLYQIPLDTYVENPGLKDKILKAGDAVFVDTTYDLDRALAFYQAKIDVISLRTSTRISSMEILQAEVGLRRSALEEQRSNFERRRALGEETQEFVYLTGEVNDQSRFALPYGRRATLADVLYAEGGFDTTTGDPSQIYVLRAETTSKGEGITAYHLNAENAAKLVLATKFEMRPSDVIFVEEQPITKWNRTLQQFLPSVLSAARSAAAG
ncbi:polysaccharide biosynthesis/export family protein [Sagittula sp. NFXS13]|nr:polysaccharide biosynthesis/export family protein [Sagittula marina]